LDTGDQFVACNENWRSFKDRQSCVSIAYGGSQAERCWNALAINMIPPITRSIAAAQIKARPMPSAVQFAVGQVGYARIRSPVS
jgi:PAB1-binding protein PBP1